MNVFNNTAIAASVPNTKMLAWHRERLEKILNKVAGSPFINGYQVAAHDFCRQMSMIDFSSYTMRERTLYRGSNLKIITMMKTAAELVVTIDPEWLAILESIKEFCNNYLLFAERRKTLETAIDLALGDLLEFINESKLKDDEGVKVWTTELARPEYQDSVWPFEIVQKLLDELIETDDEEGEVYKQAYEYAKVMNLYYEQFQPNSAV